MEGVRISNQERAKRGNYTASNPPPNCMHEPGPKKADLLARYSKNPKEPIPHQKLPQPEFSLLPACTVDHLTVPDVYDEEPDESVTLLPVPRSVSVAPPKSASSQPSGPVPEIPTASTGSRKRGAALKAGKKISKMVDVTAPDDEDQDVTFEPEKETETVEAEEDPDETQPHTMEESIKSGIPMSRNKRQKKKDPAIFKYPCDLCGDRFQKTNDLRDHKYVLHLGKFYDCEACVKHYKLEKALIIHIKTTHNGVGRVKCSEEGCTWVSKDTGTLHQHLLTIHEIGEPIKCQMLNSDGVPCRKVFMFSERPGVYKDVHKEKNVECNLCKQIICNR